MTRRVVVVGGGLAGISAALECADSGAAATLLERRNRLGGLTWSFRHGGWWIDNGQHVFLRCCDQYSWLLERIGAAGDVTIQDRLDIPVVAPGHPPLVGRLRRNGWPAPLHLGPALLRYPHLTWPARAALAPAVLALRRLDLDDPALDEQTFGGWLERRGQSDAAVAALWDLITVPTVNLPAAEASLAMAAKVFQTGLLTDRRAADIGWSRVPLGQLHGERAGAALAKAGVQVRTGARVEAIERLAAGGFAVRVDGDSVEADRCVLAVPHDQAAGVLPPGALAHQDRLEELGHSAVMDVHLVFDRRVTSWSLMAGLGSPVQWVFDRTASAGGAQTGEQYLAVSVSNADDLMGRHPDELIPWIVAELGRLLPAAAGARLVDSLVTKERQATFRAVPGTAALRPSAVTAYAGLAVAGAWTATGWPATMEGAVRSGRAAARAVLDGAGANPLSIPDHNAMEVA